MFRIPSSLNSSQLLLESHATVFTTTLSANLLSHLPDLLALLTYPAFSPSLTIRAEMPLRSDRGSKLEFTEKGGSILKAVAKDTIFIVPCNTGYTSENHFNRKMKERYPVAYKHREEYVDQLKYRRVSLVGCSFLDKPSRECPLQHWIGFVFVENVDQIGMSRKSQIIWNFKLALQTLFREIDEYRTKGENFPDIRMPRIYANPTDGFWGDMKDECERIEWTPSAPRPISVYKPMNT